MAIPEPRHSGSTVTLPGDLLAAAETAVAEFEEETGTVRWATPLALEWLGVSPAGRGLVAPGFDPALKVCLAEAARRDGTAAGASVRSAGSEWLAVTAMRTPAGTGRGVLLCLLRREPARAGLSETRTRDPELLEAMVETSEDRLMIVAADGVILDLNFGSVFGKEVIGRNVKELEEAGYFDRSVALEVIRAQASMTMIQTARNGRKLLVTGKPVFAPSGRLKYVVLTARDITELNQVMTDLEETRKLSERYRTELRLLKMRDLDAGQIVVRSPQMQAVYEVAVRCATVDLPVLLLGETGTGKGVFAKLIHARSARSSGPFLEVNCGAIPEGLMEAELFGYAKGAFTGADPRGKVGLIELAHTGTLLLNEIGDLPLALQVKLLRFLEDGEIQRVGAVKPRRPDVRIIAATNRNLGEMMGQGRFRQDLFYRLNVIVIPIPPLREHREDVPWLIETMLSQLERKLRRRPRISPVAMDLICRYSFPGNVRELWNLMERLVVTTDAEVIEASHLPADLTPAPSPAALPERSGTLRQALQQAEAHILRHAIKRYRTQTLAARHLGLGQATISRKLRKYGLQ